MGMTNYPVNSTDQSTLKLVAAARLPEHPPKTHKADAAIGEKKNVHSTSAELSNEAQVQISKLKARDTEVRQHEQAHISASGGLNVSGASYTYQRGPNGVNYAVGGDVRIDTSPGHTPEETLSRAEKIIDAALAPVDPSPVDRSVAAKAQNMAQQARIEIQQQENIARSKPADPQSIINQTYDSKDSVKAKIDTYV